MKPNSKLTKNHSVVGLIVAGGNGRRMGGLQKGLLQWRSKPLIHHIIERLQPQCDSLSLNVNQQLEHYHQFGLPIIRDHDYQQAGPLAGLHSGLSQISCDFLVTVPCDAPLFPLNLVEKLYVAAVTHHGMAVAKTEYGLQPTFAIVNTSYLASLEKYLNQGQRKTQLWFSENRAETVEFPLENFVNINTPEDLANLNASNLN